jgi:prophage antirepressor-like protein
VDVVQILTDSSSPKTYWAKLKKKLSEESGVEVFRIWEQLKMPAADGKNYKTDATNTEGVFRIIMSVASPKAEPFKQWLAQVGKEQLEE